MQVAARCPTKQNVCSVIIAKLASPPESAATDPGSSRPIPAALALAAPVDRHYHPARRSPGTAASPPAPSPPDPAPAPSAPSGTGSPPDRGCRRCPRRGTPRWPSCRPRRTGPGSASCCPASAGPGRRRPRSRSCPSRGSARSSARRRRCRSSGAAASGRPPPADSVGATSSRGTSGPALRSVGRMPRGVAGLMPTPMPILPAASAAAPAAGVRPTPAGPVPAAP
mmetsp:Transcript_29241/g.85038  ORF Transcript_29241/g.85038 Transcript_29241/m.85038 type:complete len:225 (+) Transcript_29241:40-714(+)